MNLRTAGLILAILFCFLTPTMAQNDQQFTPLPPPVEAFSDSSDPYADSFTGAVFIPLPLYSYSANITATSIEANEVAHPCRSINATAGSHSVWFRFDVPQGRVRISTEGTKLSDGTTVDTVASLWSGTTMANLTNTACNDDEATGKRSSSIDTVLSSGSYYLQVSRWENTPLSAGKSLTLRLKIGFKPHGSVPSNDLFASALPISIPYNGIVTNVERATNEINEAVHPCIGFKQGMHSLWYKFTLPFAMTVNLSTDGSNYATLINSNADTIVSIWTKQAKTLVNVACNDNGIGVASVIEQNLQPGTYFVQVSQSVSTSGAVYASRVSLRLAIPTTGAAIINENQREGGFETPLSSWIGSNLTGDKRRCNIDAYAGSCSFVFKGSANENSSITQTIKKFGSFALNAGDFFELRFRYASTNIETGKVKAVVKIVYKDGTPPSIVTVPLTANNAGEFPLGSVMVESSAIRKVVLSFQNKSKTGTVTLDYVVLDFRLGALRSGASVSPEVLPPPTEPEGFRGSN